MGDFGILKLSILGVTKILFLMVISLNPKIDYKGS